MFNYKLYFKFILIHIPFSFIENFFQKEKNYSLLVPSNNLLYLGLHLKFSTIFFSTQFVDNFGYEIPSLNKNLNLNSFLNFHKNTSTVLLYNFHNMISQDRFFFYFTNTNNSTQTYVYSLSEIFFSANWLERELSELHGIGFLGKKDLRNLMLQYGDCTFPFQKSFPTIGVREMYYDSVKDTIIQTPISVQL